MLFHIDYIYAFNFLWEKPGFCLDIRMHQLWLTDALSCEVFALVLVLVDRKDTSWETKQNFQKFRFARHFSFASSSHSNAQSREKEIDFFLYKCIWDEFEALRAAMKLSCGCVSIQNEMYTMRVINCCLLINWFTFVGGRHLTTSDTGFLTSRLSPNCAYFVECLSQEEREREREKESKSCI
jgi:hypothetical protein